MSLQHDLEQVANSNSCLNEEKEKFKVFTTQENMMKLQKAQSYSSSNGPTTPLISSKSSSASPLTAQQSLGCTKPTLIRQDRATSSYLASPQLSTLGTSDETSDDDNSKSIQYHLMPNLPTNATTTRCRHCHLNERRSSVSPSSVIHMPRSNSKESLEISNLAILQNIPPVFITGSPSRAMQLPRQSSQPEAATHSCCGTHTQQASPIAGIATETLRVLYWTNFIMYLILLYYIYSLMEQ